MTKDIREKGAAANTLRRLRRLAAELEVWGWDVKEPADALEVVYELQVFAREAAGPA